MISRTNSLLLASVFVALSGCGGHDDHSGTSHRALPGPSRLRFFNGSSQCGLGLALNGVALTATGASSADSGEGVAYADVPDGTYDLSAKADGGSGTQFGSLSGVSFAQSGQYTGYAYGYTGAGGLVFASDTALINSANTQLDVQIISLIGGATAHYAAVYRNDQTALALNFPQQGASGFSDLSGSFGIGIGGAIRYTVALNSDGTTKTPIGTPFEIPLETSRPVTIVIYGSPTSPRYAVLYGTFANATVDAQ